MNIYKKKKSRIILSNYLQNFILKADIDSIDIITKYIIRELPYEDIIYVCYHTKCSEINALLYLSQSQGNKIYIVKKLLNKHRY